VSYLIAAAGTGGHVYPGLAVGEALVEAGVAAGEILYVGGDRLEKEVYPAAGFPFLQIDIAGLRREWTSANLSLPAKVFRTSLEVARSIDEREVRVVLGMGGYVTVPVALAARRRQRPLFLAEQNAAAGLANRFAARFAQHIFGSFPITSGLPAAEWVGNPVRRSIRLFDRAGLRPEARHHFGLDPEGPVVGVLGGSLGAGALNRVAALLADPPPPYAILNLSGAGAESEQQGRALASGARWIVRGFESRMELFYAAVDAVVARAGGAVAELTATATPSVLIPGGFGSGGHQEANAAFLAATGAAMLLPEEKLEDARAMVLEILTPTTHSRIAEATKALARPEAAITVAEAMRSVHAGSS
jgi:UDP-N-acetylglucosamine--N-acetylmuramyl-(pentapeptide) pyrophosphoryl-undecaprenol N-acetylglucosamine transferase